MKNLTKFSSFVLTSNEYCEISQNTNFLKMELCSEILSPLVPTKGKSISKQNCWAVNSSKKQTNNFFFLSWSTTWNQNSSFKYFRVVRIEKQICSFVFWKKLADHKFLSRLADLYLSQFLGMLILLYEPETENLF